ncbi:hypothetical protein EYF80_046260 [Liparis tanakae]|uniref:Uncharacterized protein n=1 Tax=Liparis tanakae TaxID=230148 RepID=A0A4Z2FQX6_9TELE|nr:hypothetical protein EYF80_046260 [Liparis tanakae]
MELSFILALMSRNCGSVLVNAGQNSVLHMHLPSSGKVSPVGDDKARQVSVSVPVRLWSGEGFAEHVLQVIGVVGSHPVVGRNVLQGEEVSVHVVDPCEVVDLGGVVEQVERLIGEEVSVNNGNSPKMVMLSGSPPNVRMFLCTQAMAACWSHRP